MTGFFKMQYSYALTHLLVFVFVVLIMTSSTSAFTPRRAFVLSNSLVPCLFAPVGSSCRVSSALNLAAQPQQQAQSTATLKERLSAAGRGALLSYGVLNFLYYVTLTTVAWTFSNAGRAEAVSAAALSPSTLTRRVSVSAVRLGKVMGIVWAGSQITKPFRITGSIILAPVANNILFWFQRKLRLKNSETAFAALCACLLGSTAVYYALLLTFSAAG